MADINSNITKRFLKTSPIKPETFNDKTRSVKIVAKSEQPVLHIDPEFQKPVYIVTLLDGARWPDNNQVPLLDSHNRFSVSNVLGSARNFKVSGKNLECEVFFSGTKNGINAAQQVKEGHITDFSIGCRYIEHYWIPKGKEQEILAHKFTGPLRVVTQWYIYELSIVAIGADINAKVRFKQPEVLQSDEKQVNNNELIDKIFYGFILFMLFFILSALLFF